MMKNEIPEEVLFDIEMESYMKYNDTIATMNEWLGEIYSLQDVKDMEQAQKEYEEQCKKDYLDGKRKYTEEDLKNIKKAMGGE